MTNPIPRGTCNLGLNMTREERSLWGRFAYEQEASFNQTIQELALRGLRDVNPALAAEIAKHRKARGLVVNIAKTSFCLALVGALLAQAGQARFARSLRVRRNEVEEVAA